MEDDFYELEGLSADELSKKLSGYQDQYERACATSCSFMNAVEKWLNENSKRCGKNVGFLIVNDLLEIAFLFIENFVSIEIYLDPKEEIKLKVNEKIEKIKKIKIEAINEISKLISSSKAGMFFEEEILYNEIEIRELEEIKKDFHDFIMSFYNKTRTVQKNQTSIMMTAGLLASIVLAMESSDKDLRDDTADMIHRIKDAWTRIII